MGAIKSEARGPDGIEPWFVKRIASNIVAPLTRIINSSIVLGNVPLKWKESIVHPIPKKPNPASFTDYRPITILSYFAKIQSKIISEQYSACLEENDIISEYQSAFRRNHSCTTAGVKVVEDIRSGFRTGAISIAVLVDLKAAFPSIDHRIVMECLRIYNADESSRRFFSSFIVGRCQRTVHGQKLSNSVVIKKGVLQGDANAQVLFNSVINLVEERIKHCKFHIYADDLIIYTTDSVDNIHQMGMRINSDLRNLNELIVSIGMAIKPIKSQCIIFRQPCDIKKIDETDRPIIHIDDNEIEYRDSVVYLGFTLDTSLSPIKSVDAMLGKVYGSLAGLRHLRNTIPNYVKIQIIDSLVLPVFDYGDVLYETYDITGFKSKMNEIQRAHNSCLRFALSLKFNDSISYRRNRLRMLTMSNRRQLHVCVMVHSIVLGLTPKYLNGLYEFIDGRTRQNGMIKIERIRRSNDAISLAVGGAEYYNAIPDRIKSLRNMKEFSSAMKQYLFDVQLKT